MGAGRLVRWFAVAFALSVGASAEPFDPSVGLTLGAAPPRALAAAPSLDATSSGQVRVELPTRATPAYRIKLAAPIPFAPAADESGALVVAHGPGKLTQLDARGRVIWSSRVSPDLAATGPLIGNDGLRWLVTLGGEVAGVAADGRISFHKPLVGFGSLQAAQAIPLSTGGIAVAAGHAISVLDRSGNALWHASSDEAPRVLIEHGAELLVVTADGHVLGRGAEGQLSERAHLGGQVDAAALLPESHELAAVIGQRELVLLDLTRGKRRVLLAEPALSLSSGLAANSSGQLRVIAQGGLLLGLDRTGKESFRAPLAATTLGLGGQPPSPLIDASGRSAVTLPDAGLALVSARGEVEVVTESACPEPLRPTPIAARTLVLSCRSGLVFALSDRAR
jgi:hypothetical protein